MCYFLGTPWGKVAAFLSLLKSYCPKVASSLKTLFFFRALQGFWCAHRAPQTQRVPYYLQHHRMLVLIPLVAYEALPSTLDNGTPSSGIFCGQRSFCSHRGPKEHTRLSTFICTKGRVWPILWSCDTEKGEKRLVQFHGSCDFFEKPTSQRIIKNQQNSDYYFSWDWADLCSQ